MIQGAQLGTGIMIVRLLGREEYALYFLAFSLVSMISVLTSSGLVAGFNRIALPTRGLSPGAYVLRASAGRWVRTHRFVVR